MTNPATTTPVEGEVLDRRPEPVLNAGKLAGLIAAVVVAVVGVVLIVAAGLTLDDLDPLGQALAGAGTAIAAVIAYVAPVWQAHKARGKVTPLEDPVTADGIPLVTPDELAVVDQADELVTTNDADLVDAAPLEDYLVDTRTPGEAAHGAPE